MNSDLNTYIRSRSGRDPAFCEDFDSGYTEFKIGALLRNAREEAGVTQDELARRIHTTKSVISRAENHAQDIRLSTLEKYAGALGKKLSVTMT